MLKINIFLRFALMGVSLVAGLLFTFLDGFGFWYAFPFYLILLVLLLGYIFLGTIQSAAELMQAQDFEGADKRLGLTLKPNWLYATNKAYYYMIKGSIALSRHDSNEGERWLKKAQEVKIPTEQEKAMLEIQLASISASKGRWKQAQLHYKAAKQLKITDEAVKEQLKQLEKALNNRGQQMAATRSGAKGAAVMRPGGKRRRPKMR
jgi:hypothetical protein